MDIPKSFISIIIFFNEPSEYGDSGVFILLWWTQKLRQSKWGYNILYADRSSEGELQLLRPLLRETKIKNMAYG
jgi:hypothetical protein